MLHLHHFRFQSFHFHFFWVNCVIYNILVGITILLFFFKLNFINSGNSDVEEDNYGGNSDVEEGK